MNHKVLKTVPNYVSILLSSLIFLWGAGIFLKRWGTDKGGGMIYKVEG